MNEKMKIIEREMIQNYDVNNNNKDNNRQINRESEISITIRCV